MGGNEPGLSAINTAGLEVTKMNGKREIPSRDRRSNFALEHTHLIFAIR